MTLLVYYIERSLPVGSLGISPVLYTETFVLVNLRWKCLRKIAFAFVLAASHQKLAVAL